MFALVAWSRGYKFNFVEGEMWEKSPFTLGDYIKQRKRWFCWAHVYFDESRNTSQMQNWYDSNRFGLVFSHW